MRVLQRLWIVIVALSLLAQVFFGLVTGEGELAMLASLAGLFVALPTSLLAAGILMAFDFAGMRLPQPGMAILYWSSMIAAGYVQWFVLLPAFARFLKRWEA